MYTKGPGLTFECFGFRFRIYFACPLSLWQVEDQIITMKFTLDKSEEQSAGKDEFLLQLLSRTFII